MTRIQRGLKRGFDIGAAVVGLAVLWPVIVTCIILAKRDTGLSGLFVQQRLGRHAKPFSVYKIRTMRTTGGSSITTRGDARITPLGATLRKYKLDELPQLWNVLIGDMSFVGPRPDVPGYLDKVGTEWAEVLDLRPGITGPATLRYRNEEELLANVEDPTHYNDTVIWPDKLQINRNYARNWSMLGDLRYIWQTIT